MASATNVAKLRGADTEKMTINVSVVDLGQIDLLVQEGFYSNRSDLIRTAIRTQLQSHADVVKHTIARRTLVVGLQDYNADDLRRIEAAGQTLRIQALGLVRIAADVSPELARATIESVSILGAFHCSEPVRNALAGRISHP
jgi:Arc/MetJ-type ribon-helix-helix transcriptional regulator